MMKLSLLWTAAALCSSWSAFAQRTDDNAVKEADDAFGKSVGDEQIGIYNAGMVRGFSPADLLKLARGPCPADERAAIKRELHRWPDAAFWAGVFEMDPVDMRAPASRREFRGGKTTRMP